MLFIVFCAKFFQSLPRFYVPEYIIVIIAAKQRFYVFGARMQTLYGNLLLSLNHLVRLTRHNEYCE